MRDVLYLAWRYLASHRVLTAILIFAITLIIFLPVGLRVLVRESERELTTRDGVGLSQRRKWSVKADLWGRLRELVELRPR